MVGFIGAMSSALCIILLVFITLLIGYIKSLLPDTGLFRIDEFTFRYPVTTYFVNSNMAKDIASTIEYLKDSEDFNSDEIYLGCTYGFDFNYESANNISIFNAIKVSSFKTGLSTSIYENFPNEEHKLNYCFLDFKTKGGSNG